MKALFVALPAFERHRDDYLDDDNFWHLQMELMSNPEAGDLIAGTGGLRKLRFRDARRGKGKRGGLRVNCYFWLAGPESWLFTMYDKDRPSDLIAKQRMILKEFVKNELKVRKQ